MIKKLIEIIKIKSKIDGNNPWAWWWIKYLKETKNEVDEALEEVKKNNSVYLEDELWDILYDYLSALENFTKEWKITSIEKVIERAEKKYSERIWWFSYNENWELISKWKEIKEKQKKELKEEHEELYGNK